MQTYTKGIIQKHAAIGLMYFRARYYDPATGEFISRDPLGYVDGMSLYRGYFVPNGMDPTGTEEECHFDTGNTISIPKMEGGNSYDYSSVPRGGMAAALYLFYQQNHPSSTIRLHEITENDVVVLGGGFLSEVTADQAIRYLSYGPDTDAETIGFKAKAAAAEACLKCCLNPTFEDAGSQLIVTQSLNNVRFALQKYTVYYEISGKANCDGESYQAEVKWTLYDKYDFPFWAVPVNLGGTNFHITANWNSTVSGSFK